MGGPRCSTWAEYNAMYPQKLDEDGFPEIIDGDEEWDQLEAAFGAAPDGYPNLPTDPDEDARLDYMCDSTPATDTLFGLVDAALTPEEIAGIGGALKSSGHAFEQWAEFHRQRAGGELSNPALEALAEQWAAL